MTAQNVFGIRNCSHEVIRLEIGDHHTVIFLDELAESLPPYSFKIKNLTEEIQYNHTGVAPETGDRVLLFNHIADAKALEPVYPTFYHVSYVDQKTANDYKIRPLREVVAPTVRRLSHNRFLMTFWSNFYKTYDAESNGYTDDPTALVYMKETVTSEEGPTTDTVYKAMFSTVITFKYVLFQENGDQVRRYFPLCTKPSFMYKNENNLYGITPGAVSEEEAAVTAEAAPVFPTNNVLVKNDGYSLLCWGMAVQAEDDSFASATVTDAFPHVTANVFSGDAPANNELVVFMLEDTPVGHVGWGTKDTAHVLLHHSAPTPLNELTASTSFESLVSQTAGLSGFKAVHQAYDVHGSLFNHYKNWQVRFKRPCSTKLSTYCNVEDNVLELSHEKDETSTLTSPADDEEPDYLWFGMYHEFDLRVSTDQYDERIFQPGQGFFFAVWDGASVVGLDSGLLNTDETSTRELFQVQAVFKLIDTQTITVDPDTGITVEEVLNDVVLRTIVDGAPHQPELSVTNDLVRSLQVFRNGNPAQQTFTVPVSGDENKVIAPGNHFAVRTSSASPYVPSGAQWVDHATISPTGFSNSTVFVSFGLLNNDFPAYFDCLSTKNQNNQLTDGKNTKVKSGTLTKYDPNNDFPSSPDTMNYVLALRRTEFQVLTVEPTTRFEAHRYYYSTDHPAWTVSVSPPPDPEEDDLWWNSSEDQGYQYENGSWEETDLPRHHSYKVIKTEVRNKLLRLTLVSPTDVDGLSEGDVFTLKRGGEDETWTVSFSRKTQSLVTRFYVDVDTTDPTTLETGCVYRASRADGSEPQDYYQVSNIASPDPMTLSFKWGERDRTAALVRYFVDNSRRLYKFRNDGDIAVVADDLLRPHGCSGWSATDQCFSLEKNDVDSNLFVFRNVSSNVDVGSTGQCVSLAGTLDVTELPGAKVGDSAGPSASGTFALHQVGLRVVAYDSDTQTAYLMRDQMPSQLLRVTNVGVSVLAQTVDETGNVSGVDITGTQVT